MTGAPVAAAPKGFECVVVRFTTGEQREYASQLLPADTGFETAAKLLGLLAGPLGSVLSAAMGLRAGTSDEGESAPAPSFSEADLNPEVLQSALTTLGLSLRDPALMEIVRVMMPRVEFWGDGTERKRQPIQWGQEFAGEYGALLEVLFFTLRHNFRSFFSTGPASVLRSGAQNLGASILQRASTGGSRRLPVAMARPSSPTPATG